MLDSLNNNLTVFKVNGIENPVFSFKIEFPQSVEGTSQWFSVNIRILRQFPDLLDESSLDFFIITLQSILCGSPDDDPVRTHNQYTRWENK